MTQLQLTPDEKELWASITAGSIFTGKVGKKYIVRGSILRSFYVNQDTLNDITAAGIHIDGT